MWGNAKKGKEVNDENNVNKSKQPEARAGNNRRPATEIMKKVARVLM